MQPQAKDIVVFSLPPSAEPLPVFPPTEEQEALLQGGSLLTARGGATAFRPSPSSSPPIREHSPSGSVPGFYVGQVLPSEGAEKSSAAEEHWKVEVLFYAKEPLPESTEPQEGNARPSDAPLRLRKIPPPPPPPPTATVTAPLCPLSPLQEGREGSEAELEEDDAFSINDENEFQLDLPQQRRDATATAPPPNPFGTSSKKHPLPAAFTGVPEEDLLEMDDVEEMSQRRHELQQDIQLSRDRVAEIHHVLSQRQQRLRERHAEAKRMAQQSSKDLMVAYSMIAAVQPQAWREMRQERLEAAPPSTLVSSSLANSRRRTSKSGGGAAAEVLPKVQLLWEAIGHLLGEEVVNQHWVAAHEGGETPNAKTPNGKENARERCSASPSPSRATSKARTQPPQSRDPSLGSLAPERVPLHQRVRHCSDLPMLLTCFDTSPLVSTTPSDSLTVPLQCISEWDSDVLDAVSPVCVALFRWVQAVVQSVQAQQRVVREKGDCTVGQPETSSDVTAAEPCLLEDGEPNEAALRRELEEHEEYLEMANAELLEIEELLTDMVKAHHLQMERLAQPPSSSALSLAQPQQDIAHDAGVTGHVRIIPRGHIFFIFPRNHSSHSRNEAEEGEEEALSQLYFHAHSIEDVDAARNRGDDDDSSYLSPELSSSIRNAFRQHQAPAVSSCGPPPPKSSHTTSDDAARAIPLLDLTATDSAPPPLNSVRCRFDRLHGTPRLTTPRIGGGRLRTARAGGGPAVLLRSHTNSLHPPSNGPHSSSTAMGGGLPIGSPRIAPQQNSNTTNNTHSNTAFFQEQLRQVEREKLQLEETNRKLEAQVEKALRANPAQAQLELMEKELEAYAADFHRVKEERDQLLADRRSSPFKGGHSPSSLGAAAGYTRSSTVTAYHKGVAHLHDGASAPSFIPSQHIVIEKLEEELCTKCAVIAELEDKLSVSLSTIQQLERNVQEAVQQQPGRSSPADSPLSLPLPLSVTPRRPVDSGGEGIGWGERHALPSPLSSTPVGVPSPSSDDVTRLTEEKTSVEFKLNRALHAEKEKSEALQKQKTETATLWKHVEELRDKLQKREVESQLLVQELQRCKQESMKRQSSDTALLHASSLSLSTSLHSQHPSGVNCSPSGVAASSIAGEGAGLHAASPAGSLMSFASASHGTASATTTVPIDRMTLMELRHAVRQLQQQLEKSESSRLRLEMEQQATRRTLTEERRRIKSLRHVRLQVLEKMSETVQNSLAQHQTDTEETSKLLKQTGEEFMVSLNRLPKSVGPGIFKE